MNVSFSDALLELEAYVRAELNAALRIVDGVKDGGVVAIARRRAERETVEAAIMNACSEVDVFGTVVSDSGCVLLWISEKECGYWYGLGKKRMELRHGLHERHCSSW